MGKISAEASTPNKIKKKQEQTKKGKKKQPCKKVKCNLKKTKNIQTPDRSVLELMTQHPDLKQTFEYMLYSNKYKHTLTDVFNIIKMLMTKLEELQSHNIDIQNVFDTVNFNYKIRGLVQSTAINLSHVLEQLNINETNFLNFARSCNSICNIDNNKNMEKSTENKMYEQKNLPSTFQISNAIRVKSHDELNNDLSLIEEIKNENIYTNTMKKISIIGSKETVVLSSDDELEESKYYNKCLKRNVWEEPKKSDADDLESYAIGSDFTDILSDNDSFETAINTKEKRKKYFTVSPQNNSSLTQKSKKVRQKIPEEVINEARKLDIRQKKRLKAQNTLVMNIVNKIKLRPHDVVLEFDVVNQIPSICVNKELSKVLKPHQVEGIRFLWDTVFESIEKSNSTDGTGCILAHRMGIGKTLQVIALMYTILSEPKLNIKTFLIICPPGLIYNWIDEIYKWLKDIDKSEVFKVYDLPKTNKLYNITNIATWKSKGGALVLSYENFKSLVNCNQRDLREAFSHTLINPGPDVVILDEGHYIKNTHTILLKTLSQIRTKRRIVLTGTPMQNSLKEYYTLVDFVKPNILGNFGDFALTFIKPIDSGQFIDSSDDAVKLMKERTFILHRLLQNTVHRIDDKSLTSLFTEKVEYTVEINMSEFQRELYEKFLHYDQNFNDRTNVFWRLHVLTLITLHPLTLYRLIRLENYRQSSDQGVTVLGEKLRKALQWINDYKDDSRFFEAKQSNKITYVLAMIEECEKRNEKMLCFLKSPLAMDALEYFLQKEKNWILGEKYFRMDGKTPVTIRNQMCEAFNNSENSSRVFILSMGTGGLGFNMVGANRVLLLNASWNPSVDIQAIYRCLRFGQSKTVYVNRILAKGTVEPKAYYRQISKLGISSSVVDMQHVYRQISSNQINDLFVFDSFHFKVHYSLVPNTKDPVLNQLIRNNLDCIYNVQEHDSLLVESVENHLTSEEKKAIWLAFKNNELCSKNKFPLNLQDVEQPKMLSTLIMDSGIPEPNDTSRHSISQNVTNQKNLRNYFNNKNTLSHSHNSYDNQNVPSEIQDNFTSQSNANQNSHQKIFNNKNCLSHISYNSESSASTKTQNKLKCSKLNTMRETNYSKKNFSVVDEPIQNQFRHFQNKTFNNHKRFPRFDKRQTPYSKAQTRNISKTQNIINSSHVEFNQYLEANTESTNRHNYKQNSEEHYSSDMLNQNESLEQNNYYHRRGNQYSRYHHYPQFKNNICNRSGNSR
ncbi:transcriptional regulator ATRX homolog [Daktulosphaira vitifoliae]|uniref:transcriptional regulator ATRX homolog n=1 Tax=Daktulosphaira vitifoliae TaxID=58002 RepID=UPI0021A9A978|nr:transcriptional regulator ATRX homolog [Daktulosphaira vitifoliae]